MEIGVCLPPYWLLFRSLRDPYTDRMTARVTDGVTVCHPCCSELDCRIPLDNQRDCFCSQHSQQYQGTCCVTGCTRKAEQGYETCDTPTHRQFQLSRQEHNTAMFQLWSRLATAGVASVQLAGSSNIPRPSTFTSDCPPHTATLETTNPNSDLVIKGRISHCWTHNEQLFIKCCDVIISCATMFGSEGTMGVKVRLL